MQFSASINNIKKQTWWERFSSQPHQLFFSCAILFSFVVMFLSIFALLGNYNLDFTLIHGFGLNYAVFTNAFLGFLFTVMPKYNATKEIDKKVYLNLWALFEVSILITLFIDTNIGKVLTTLTLLYTVKLFYTIIKNGNAIEKDDSIYINTILFFGSIFPLVEVIANTNLSTMIFFTYLINLVFLVALRMVPAFYFSYTKVIPWQRPSFIRLFSVLLISLVGISMQFEVNLALQINSLFASIFFGYVLHKLNFYKKAPAMMTILIVGLVWFEVGFISVFIESIFIDYSLKLSFHIFALGFITTLLIGFGSRVTLGHSVPPQPMVADNITKVIFVFTQVVVLSRIIASIVFIFGYDFFMPVVHFSISLWLLLFIFWSYRYAKALLRIE